MDHDSPRYGREVPRWSGRPAWSQYVFLWFITAVFGVRAGLLVWWGQWGVMAIHVAGMAVFVGLAVFFRRTTRYTLTQEAVYRSAGMFGRTDQRLPLSEFESVDVGRSRLDQLLGIGTVLLCREDGTSERLAGLRDPEVIQRKIEALLRPTKLTGKTN
ncbi:MAG TPA: PH domain-containing protein [Nitrospiria bacterium]|nr:PH domain-containing protein [Nitrospiria bacterium]